MEGGALHEHAGEHHHVRPGEVLVRERLHIEIHQPAGPVLREEGRNGDQAEWREKAPAAGEAQGILPAPVGVGKLGVYEKRTH